MKKNIYAATIGSILFLFGIIFSVPSALADDDVIDVAFDPAGGIHATNLAPGQATTLGISVTSKSDEDQDLMLRLTRGTNNTLDDQMNVELRRVSGGVLLPMPNGSTSQLLSTIADNTFEFDTLGHRLSENYELVFTFNPLAGNEYQRKTSVFDLEVGVDAEEADGGNGDGNGNGNDGVTGGIATFAAGVAGLPLLNTAGAVGGAETPEEGKEMQSPLVAGEEKTCDEWTFWVWMILLAAFGALLNVILYHRAKKEIRWIVPLAEALALFLIWYYFETCRLYPWYPYAIVVAGLVSYFVYLEWFKKKMAASNSIKEEK